MKTNVFIPSSATVFCLSGKRTKEYTVNYNFASFDLKVKFVSIRDIGYWIANAHCLN